MIVFFDLPVKTKKQIKQATQFRNFLIKDGYYMLQYSVYSRLCNGNDAVEKHKIRLTNSLPEKGNIRILTVTEKQYTNIEILLGKKTKYDNDVKFEQLQFF
jgi:CRISPR-associated protein Cas2